MSGLVARAWVLASPVRTTLVIIAANVVVFAAMLARHGLDEDGEFGLPALIASGGIYVPLMRQGEWWRLMTGAFLHASAAHLAWNMVSLWMLGRFLEPRYSTRRYLVLYVIGAIASSATTTVWLWESDIVAIGASGAISALVGAGAASAYRMGLRGVEFRNSMLAWGAVVLVNGFLHHTNNIAHGTGLAVGALLVLVFGRRGVAALTSRVRSADALGVADELRCETCREPNPSGARYCGRCGAPFAGSVTSS